MRTPINKIKRFEDSQLKNLSTDKFEQCCQSQYNCNLHDSNPAWTQVQILLGSTISITWIYESNFSANQKAGLRVTYGCLQYWTEWPLQTQLNVFECCNNSNIVKEPLDLIFITTLTALICFKKLALKTSYTTSYPCFDAKVNLVLPCSSSYLS